MLFVPGHKDGWAKKAIGSGADAIILDLEDAVPPAAKTDAREHVARSCADLAAVSSSSHVWVRPNAWDTGLAGPDLAATVGTGVDGYVLPKVESERDVHYFDGLLGYLEGVAGLPTGSTKLILTLETATAMRDADRLAAASPRVVSMLGGTGPHGDIARALGYRFTARGEETLSVRSTILLACRAAGFDNPLCGLWQEVADLAGLEEFLLANRGLGYQGAMLIHPSHVPIANRLFTPDEDEFEFHEQVVSHLEDAIRRGDAATVVAGLHVDIAHAKTSQAWLDRWGHLRPSSDSPLTGNADET